MGFTGFAPKKEWSLHLRPNPLCFSDNMTLIVTFITREDVTTLARRDDSGDARPERLHGVFLEAQTGKVQSTKEWSIPRPRGGIVPAGDGRFVVLTPAMIALYSARFELLKDLKLSSEQQSHLWDFHTSSTGRSILVEYHYPEASFQWIDTISLQPQPAWNDSLPGASISDNELTISRDTYIESKGSIAEVLIRPRIGAERSLCRVLVGHGDSCGIPQFLSNDLLALLMPHDLRVVPKADGDILLKATFREDEWLGRPLHPSADGKRFAVSVWAHKGGSAFFDVSYHSVLKRIVVYDIPSRQPVYTLDAKKQNITDLSGVALSPDGSLMATLADGVVEVYRLPLP
jgi:WD40 repeat protein